MLIHNSWYAIHVRPNCESLSASSLGEKGYGVFNPTYKQRVLRRKRPVEVDTPLFKGYIFCRFNQDADSKILTSLGVRGIVGVAGKPVPIEEREMWSINVITCSGVVREPWRHMERGSRVRIESGSLRGVEGTIMSDACSRRLVVAIALLNRSVAVTLDDNVVLSALHAVS